MSVYHRIADVALRGVEGPTLTRSRPSTPQRYWTAVYEPLVSDWSNFGQWSEAGAKTATDRAHGIWKRRLAEFEPPPADPGVAEALDDFVARRTAEGGASPMD